VKELEMSVPKIRLLVVTVILAASAFAFVVDLQNAPNIEALLPELQGQSPEEVRALIIRRLGPPTRDVGSGLQIEQWDVDGGVLTFHPLTGPTFEKNREVIHLISTDNPAALCLFGSYEMVTRPEGRYGMKYWLGDVSLSADRYTYTDSRNFLEHRDKQGNNFFMLHPNGMVQVKYSSGVTPETRLEDLRDGSLVAIVTNRTSMFLAFEGKEMQFQMEKDWENYWN